MQPQCFSLLKFAAIALPPDSKHFYSILTQNKCSVKLVKYPIFIRILPGISHFMMVQFLLRHHFFYRLLISFKISMTSCSLEISHSNSMTFHEPCLPQWHQVQHQALVTCKVCMCLFYLMLLGPLIETSNTTCWCHCTLQAVNKNCLNSKQNCFINKMTAIKHA